jgi:TP53 regulating kinase and related kinases
LIQSTSPGGTEPPPGRLIYRGAEADLYRGTWEGLEAVYKVRKPLPYRLPVLDEAIRRQRTVREAEMMGAAKAAGVKSPYIFFMDPRSSTIVMEFIDGRRLRDLVPGLSSDELRGIFSLFGRDLGLLHNSGAVHGDLTTANVIRKEGDLVFVDFGLALRSLRVEDHAVDLRLIKETLFGAHSRAAPMAMASLLDGYRVAVGPARARLVQRQLSAIERRGRYARVT